MNGIAQTAQTAKRRGQRRAATKISVHTYTDEPGGVGADKNWKSEQKKRNEDTVRALEKELKDFDPVAAAAKVRRALEVELERTRLRLKESELEL